MARPANFKIILLFIVFLVLIIPVTVAENTSPVSAGAGSSPYAITLFIPTASMIHSTQIMDMVNVPDAPGTVLLATSYGLSQYNGTWSTRHINRDNTSEGLLNDYILATEYDQEGRLWIGYSGGLQIYNGQYYQTIRDQQQFKDPRVTAIRRWNNEMWVLAGNAGIHRYRNGEWTWYQPESTGGPGFFEANEMALDSAADALVISTDHEGLWRIPYQKDPVQFECIAPHDSSYGLYTQVRRDPQGGVLFFNATGVARYTQDSGFSLLLKPESLSPSRPGINDVAAGPDGRIYLATDQGIVIWKNGEVTDTINRFSGIGTFPIVEWVYVDALGRLWFSTNEDVGVITDTAHPLNLLTIESPTPEIPPADATPMPWTYLVPMSPQEITPVPQDTPENLLDSIGDPVFQALRAILAAIGFG